MEMFCFGIFAGMILAVIFIAGGAVYAKGNTERTNLYRSAGGGKWIMIQT